MHYPPQNLDRNESQPRRSLSSSINGSEILILVVFGSASMKNIPRQHCRATRLPNNIHGIEMRNICHPAARCSRVSCKLGLGKSDPANLNDDVEGKLTG